MMEFLRHKVDRRSPFGTKNFDLARTALATARHSRFAQGATISEIRNILRCRGIETVIDLEKAWKKWEASGCRWTPKPLQEKICAECGRINKGDLFCSTTCAENNRHKLMVKKQA